MCQVWGVGVGVTSAAGPVTPYVTAANTTAAPMNVAVHAHQMLRVIGGQGIVASRIGDDELGCELGRELAERGMSTQSIQIDTDRPTGQVFVTFEKGNHVFDIAKDSAWDGLQYDTGFSGLARGLVAPHTVLF